MRKINKSEVMKRAWNLFRSNAKIGTFVEALCKAWSEAKENAKITVKYIIPDWFMNKNADKLTTSHLVCSQFFGKKDIRKETERAILVELEMMTRTGSDSRYTKTVWVPKSIVEEYCF